MNRRTLKSEKLLSSSPSQKSALKKKLFGARLRDQKHNALRITHVAAVVFRQVSKAQADKWQNPATVALQPTFGRIARQSPEICFCALVSWEELKS